MKNVLEIYLLFGLYYGVFLACGLKKYFRLRYEYRLVGMMSCQKLTKRDRNQLRLPFETVRIRDSGSDEVDLIQIYDGVYKEYF